ncbi:MAG: cadmium-translocating P-type ATPase [Rhodoluna sp.]|nr:cadmium-translocating P-type ATPase [Rhodoluna sp.]
MVRFSIARSWFLITTVLSLTLGLGLINFELLSNSSFTVGALVGLALSAKWTYRTLRNRELASDSLALIAIVAGLLVGEYLATAIVALMLATGRALEDWAKGKSQAELKALLDRAPSKAHLIDEAGRTSDVTLAQISIGQSIRVLSGEVVPLDGVLLTDAELDESALTGEPMPVQRLAGDIVSSGVVNGASAIELRVNCTVGDSTYANLIRLVQRASANSAKSVRLANRWALWFVPFTLLLSAAAWLMIKDVHVAVAVLIAATPCPLILAIPVAVISGMSKSAAKGALIKGGDALELLAKAKTVMLDKTGTLTKGGPEVTEVALAPGANRAEVLGLAASLERFSPHVVARAIVAFAEREGLSTLPANEIHEEHGKQISGVVGGFRVIVGQPTGDLPEWAVLNSTLRVAISVNGKLVGVLGLNDPIREETSQTIAHLRRLGITRIVLVSGDQEGAANEVGRLIDADEVFANCTPSKKLELVQNEMAATPGSVILVGDGINDAPALAAASVGVAMGARGATAASEAADVVIIEDSIIHLATALDVSQGAFRKATQAGLVGMSLAIVSMFAAAASIINATQSAIIQEAIDAAAILWALTPLLSRIKK